jgi:hypothetical protein
VVWLAALALLGGCDCDTECEGPEICNYLDDDCDGETDEHWSGGTCGLGACPCA